MPDTNDNDINALQAQLMKAREDEGWFITGDQAKDFSRALTALVAERNALQEENNALRSRCKVHQDEVLDRVFEMDALRKRIAELEAHPPADRDRDLRERLVCAALTGLMAQPAHASRESWANIAVSFADATLAAMRKGGGA